MKKLHLLPAAVIAVLSCVSFSMQTSAVSTAGFKADDIISDAIFTYKSSMNLSQIQSFLNSKVPTCDTNGQQISEYGGPDLNKDGKVQRWEWGKAYYNQTTFPCLRNYKENGLTAAQIIYNVSQKYAINPQVMIVLLQKEQALVTDSWPLNIQYKTATGYGCPDTAPCDTQYYGLTNQLDWAAKMFRSILNNSPTWYTPYILGNNYIRYSPDSSCGGSIVNIKNRSTQALYNYTPYQPNKAALDAGWGSAPCGAYGNRNFYLYFTSWFGSTHYSVKGSIADYYYSGTVASTLGGPIENESQTAHNGWKQCFQYGCIVGRYDTQYWMIKGSIARYYWSKKGPGSALGLPTGAELNTGNNVWRQPFQNGYVIGSAGTGYWAVVNKISDMYFTPGNTGVLGLPIEDSVKGTSGEKQCFETGCIAGNDSTKYWIVKGSIGAYYWKNDGLDGQMGAPVGTEVNVGNGIYYQKYQEGYIAGRSTTGYWGIRGSIGAAFVPSDLTEIGVPVAIESQIAGTSAWQQQFENGYMVGSAKTGYWKSYGPVRDSWVSQGGANGRMGLPAENPSLATDGVAQQRFQGGLIIGKDATGYWNVKGSIYPTYRSLGGSSSSLGVPTANEGQSTDGVWSQQYENGYIVGGYKGYYESRGPIRDYWLNLGKWSGKMGAISGPIQRDSSGTTWQHYVNGVLIINPATNKAWESTGSIRQVWAGLGYQNGKLGFPAGSETYSEGIWSQSYDHGVIQTKQGQLYKVTYS